MQLLTDLALGIQHICNKPDGKFQQGEKTKGRFSEWGPRSEPEGRKEEGLKAQTQTRVVAEL